MRVIDGAKARAVAVAMAFVALLQFWPNAFAEPTQTGETVKSIEVKGPKKRKKTTEIVQAGSPWTPTPVSEIVATAKLQAEAKRADERKPNPIEVVLKTARAQLGKPYRWAAMGPNAFDCSGFTLYAWRKAGIHLPHNSSAQRAATKSVSLKNMRPGDLVFSSGHVGLYIGKGKMIHAPHSGRNVEVAPLHGNVYGAGRPGA